MLFSCRTRMEEVTLAHTAKGPLPRTFLKSAYGGKIWYGGRGRKRGTVTGNF